MKERNRANREKSGKRAEEKGKNEEKRENESAAARRRVIFRRFLERVVCGRGCSGFRAVRGVPERFFG